MSLGLISGASFGATSIGGNAGGSGEAGLRAAFDAAGDTDQGPSPAEQLQAMVAQVQGMVAAASAALPAPPPGTSVDTPDAGAIGAGDGGLSSGHANLSLAGGDAGGVGLLAGHASTGDGTSAGATVTGSMSGSMNESAQFEGHGRFEAAFEGSVVPAPRPALPEPPELSGPPALPVPPSGGSAEATTESTTETASGLGLSW